MARLRLFMTPGLRGGLAGIAIMTTAVACQDPAGLNQTVVPPEQLFWSLSINHKAVNLATVQPYDTIQLRVIARNARGDILQDAPPATFAPSSDLAIIISPDGLVKARSQTSTTGLRAIATLTYGGVTRVDTAFIVVTNTPSPQTIQTFSIGPSPGDSLTIARSALFDPRSKRLQITARDTHSTSIPRVIAFFESRDPATATINRQNGQTSIQYRTGTVVLRASAMVYGVEKTDSVLVTVTNPLLGEIGLRHTRPEYDIAIMRGGDVLWINQTADSIDIVFEDSSAVNRPSGGTPIGMAYRDVAGNIAPFPGDPASAIGFFGGKGLDMHIVRTRTFSLPGVYRYASRRFPLIHGTIHVQ